MGSIGRPVVPALPGSDLGELQRRVLDAVAHCLERVAREGDAARGPVAVRQTECVAEGLRVLLASLPAVTGGWPGDEPVDGLDTALVLSRAGDALDGLAEAARRAAVAYAVVGYEVAADIADSLMTVALALRMLVEIARRGPIHV